MRSVTPRSQLQPQPEAQPDGVQSRNYFGKSKFTMLNHLIITVLCVFSHSATDWLSELYLHSRRSRGVRGCKREIRGRIAIAIMLRGKETGISFFLKKKKEKTSPPPQSFAVGRQHFRNPTSPNSLHLISYHSGPI